MPVDKMETTRNIPSAWMTFEQIRFCHAKKDKPPVKHNDCDLIISKTCTIKPYEKA